MSETELYPVSFRYYKNRYAGILYDVDGNVLRGETGEPLNVFKEEFKDLLVEKRIYFLHHLSTEPTYAYFIVDPEQLGRFHLERTEGAPKKGVTYHVYADY